MIKAALRRRSGRTAEQLTDESAGAIRPAFSFGVSPGLEAGRAGGSVCGYPQIARSTSLPSGSASVHQSGAFSSLTAWPPAASAAAIRASAWS
jgi:hypothetical protein